MCEEKLGAAVPLGSGKLPSAQQDDQIKDKRPGKAQYATLLNWAISSMIRALKAKP